MGILDFHDELQVGGIPHLDAAVVAHTVQEVLVPQYSGHPVLVGFLSGASFCQLALLADAPRSADTADPSHIA